MGWIRPHIAAIAVEKIQNGWDQLKDVRSFWSKNEKSIPFKRCEIRTSLCNQAPATKTLPSYLNAPPPAEHYPKPAGSNPASPTNDTSQNSVRTIGRGFCVSELKNAGVLSGMP